MTLNKFLIGALVVSSLAACGHTGDLERPDPIFKESTPAPAPAPAPAPENSSEDSSVPDDELLGGL